MGREVALIILDNVGDLWETAATLSVDVPWWPEVTPISDRFPALTVVRLLSATPAPGHPMGGRSTDLASVDGDVAQLGLPLRPSSDRSVLQPQPLRMPWAEPATARRAVQWAAGLVAGAGRPRQHKTWNLSSIWSLPTPGGTVWLKSQPPFMAHEATVTTVLGDLVPAVVPQLLAASDLGIVVAQLPGRDGHDASVGQRCRIVDELVDLQLASVAVSGELIAAGVPDHGFEPLAAALRALVQRLAPDDGPLADLIDGLDERLAEVEHCGLPTVLVHGDAHPGNARIGHGRPVLFDWGDSVIGNPLLDLSRVALATSGDDAVVLAHWIERWAGASGVPRQRLARAVELLAPVLVLRDALVYQRFCDRIEPDERIYHQGDVIDQLAAASAMAAGP